MLVILFYLFLSSAFACASSVYLQYPLQDQLPLIARVNAPYSWTFATDTFVSLDNTLLDYSVSALPAWLSFNPATFTFSGTPSASDEGTPGFTVTARDTITNDTSSSYITLCVTPYPGPQLKIPIAEQFDVYNPSLSSVFNLSAHSALATGNPSLRVPPSWSFSIGFSDNTFNASGDLYYYGLQADGAALPGWITFDPNGLTFNGVTPPSNNSGDPMTVSLALYASDQENFSAASLPFDIVVAANELSQATAMLPTINITAATSFNFSLNSPDDFYGVLINGEPIETSNVSALNIDTSRYSSWLHYDSNSRTLSGNPPTSLTNNSLGPGLAVILSAINQTIQTNVSLAIVPSFFTTAQLQPVLWLPGSTVDLDLQQFYSNSSDLGSEGQSVNLTATFDPPVASSYLSFDQNTGMLSGAIPKDAGSGDSGNYGHITVTFTAYSHVTHSTSHTSLPISLSRTDYSHQPSQMSAATRKKLILGLAIGFGILGGLILLAVGLALFRRWAHVPDSAILGEEGRHAWTEDEMKWYGIGIKVDGTAREGPESNIGNGPTGTYLSEKIEQEESAGPSRYGDIGLGLHRTRTHAPSSIIDPTSPGNMRKSEFMGKIKATARVMSDKARQVSETYRRAIAGPRRPVISKPTLIMSSGDRVSTARPIDGLPIANGASSLQATPRTIEPIPFEDMDLSQYAPSGLTSLVNSPSSSTGERSIPRRRADFVPPKVPPLPQAHLRDAGTRSPSGESDRSSVASDLSTCTHEVEATVYRAKRAPSIRSASAVSVRTTQSERVSAEGGRPRLVPFTSANRVPVPKVPSGILKKDGGSPTTLPAEGSKRRSKRVASQTVKIFRDEPAANELDEGMAYVRALGDDTKSALSLPRSSGSFSLESSFQTHERAASADTNVKIPIVPRMLARTGEQFRFRVPVSYSAGTRPRTLVARLMNGNTLPRFIKVDLNAIASGAGGRLEKRVVELTGVPPVRDVGELNIGIYEKDGDKCVGRVIVEVVARS